MRNATYNGGGRRRSMISEHEVAENIKRYRKDKGYTCRDIAKMLNVSHQRVSFVENNPFRQKVETLLELAKIYEVPVCAFFMP